MNIIQKVTGAIDTYQRNHRLAGFVYAVIKKYGDDQAGYQAALLTYYGFLSLFPLLLVFTTVVDIVASNNAHLQQKLVESMTNYFPVLGNQLAEHVHTLHANGPALVIGILLTVYGARGVADAFRQGVSHIWQVPFARRDSFPQSALKSLSIILVGGIGLFIASASASVAAAAGKGPVFYLLAVVINLFVLFWMFVLLLNISLPRHVRIRELRGGAATAAVCLVVLQILGGYLLARQLKHLSALYSTFAIPLGLLFWIYLQSQVLYYAIEISNVHARQLWPRSLTGENLTPADKLNYARQAGKEKVVQPERIRTRFKDGA